MPSSTDICNLALQHLGESRISSISDTGDKVSRTCALNYPQARDEALQTHPWSCAKTQVALSKLSAAPLYRWKAAYELPADFIRLCQIGGCDAWYQNEYFDRMGRKLMIGGGYWNEDTPADTINIEYIFRQEDTSVFDPLLVECIALLLAAKMARTLTGSDSKAQTLRQEYEQLALPRARTLNAQQLYSGKNHPLGMFTRSMLKRGLGDASHVGYDEP